MAFEKLTKISQRNNYCKWTHNSKYPHECNATITSTYITYRTVHL